MSVKPRLAIASVNRCLFIIFFSISLRFGITEIVELFSLGELSEKPRRRTGDRLVGFIAVDQLVDRCMGFSFSVLFFCDYGSEKDDEGPKGVVRNENYRTTVSVRSLPSPPS
jgi:hypothetical protein